MANSDVDGETFHHFLRETRIRHGLTLNEVAERTGISVTHMSRLERGQRQPSIGVLRQLAELYGVGIGELVGETAAVQHKVVRVDTPLRPEESDNGPNTTLTGIAGHNGLGVVQLDISEETRRHRLSQHDDEEWIYVLRGRLELELGSETLQLGVGDSIHFDARTPHRLTPASRKATRVLIVCAPLRLRPPGNAHLTSSGTARSGAAAD
jgi:transcriptional regulator with XRE-family HTH domain